MVNIDDRDRGSLEKLLQAQPVWLGNEPAVSAINLDSSIILHAGPPFVSVDEIPAPVMNSAAVALVYEKQAQNFESARAMIEAEEISLQPAQDHLTVVPLAGVVSSSMWLHKVVDANNPNNVVHSPLNGGNGPAMRLGLCSDSALTHLQWINQELVEVLERRTAGPVDLIEMAKEALSNGDDCHGRTIAATHNLIERMKPEINAYPVQKTFLEESPSFALNLLMGAAKCMLLAADHHPGSGIVTAAGGNGVRTGIKVADDSATWVTASANPPVGDLGGHPRTRALGAIGDSAVLDMIGFGAMAVAYARAQREMFGNHLPADADQLPDTLLSCIHRQFGTLQFRTGLSVRTVVEQQSTPIVSLGVIDREGTAGRLGGGIYRYPASLFENALASIDVKNA